MAEQEKEDDDAALGDLAARESLDIFLMHLYTNYVIRESQAKTSVHPIKKGRAKRGKAALESWGQAKESLNNSIKSTA